MNRSYRSLLWAHMHMNAMKPTEVRVGDLLLSSNGIIGLVCELKHRHALAHIHSECIFATLLLFRTDILVRTTQWDIALKNNDDYEWFDWRLVSRRTE